jgi:hypothetical protein
VILEVDPIGDISVIRSLFRVQKTLKKVKKKLASPWRLPLNGDLTRQTGRKSRSKKL